ncbi:PQQ-binding-like beta-propeller repeat protein [Streptomyces sp. NPDC050704]|uniref:outer membrane protein assembly factor BamB family protein n=1 Tax=Streptomyces sp. NPDC050704 TaxID=3157219 RepID=UPI00343968FE
MRLRKPDPEAPGWALLTLGIALILVLSPRILPTQDRENHDRQNQVQGDLITGARGPFPAAFAAEAPVEPDHVIRRTVADGDVLVHGLGIRWTESGVRAVNLRTGKEYWRYERREAGAAADATSFDVSERTVVIDFRDGRVVGIDLRTGKPRWRTETEPETETGEEERSLAEAMHGGPNGMNGMNQLNGTVSLADGQAVTETTTATVLAVSERDGRRLWTAKAPKSCPDVSVRTAYAFPDHLTAVLVDCDPTNPETSHELLLGVDNRTGDVLWQRPADWGNQPLRGDENTLVALDPNPLTPRAVHLLEVNRDGVSERADFSVTRGYGLAAAEGVALSNIDPEIYHLDSKTLLSAYATKNGHRMWRVRAPSGQAYGGPAIADGRVYVVRQPIFIHVNGDGGSPARAELLVLDADTGRLLHTLRLPGLTVPEDVDLATLSVCGIGGGAVSVCWPGETQTRMIATD